MFEKMFHYLNTVIYYVTIIETRFVIIVCMTKYLDILKYE